MLPSVSIAMATYNGARYIGEQLDSFVRQTHLPAELVVTDDGSTDNTLDIIAAFAATAPFPVRVEKNAERLGYRANFQKVASLCRSALIAFSDQDDIWLPRKLETCLGAFDNPDILLTYHNATVVNEALEPIGSLNNRAPPRLLNRASSIEPWQYGLGFTLVFRRDLMAFANFWQESIDFYFQNVHEAHDQWFFFLASSLGHINYIREPLVLYRQHEANTCGWGENAPSMAGHFSNLRASSIGGLRSREISAGRRSAILEAIAKELPNEWGHRAYVAARNYRKLENSYRLRQEVYTAPGVLSKLFRVAMILWLGGYLPRQEWGAGPKALARDIIRGLIIPIKSE